MVFSSITFIYYFLPLLIILYFITSYKYKNIILLLFSLIFYTLGEPKYIIILILSCIINYYLSKKIYNNKNKKIYLITSILCNLSNFLIFKYTDFFISNLNHIFKINIPYLNIVMPLGISFYTFQILAYIIDIYREKHKPAKNLLEFMTYVCLFPQLVAGPIVRYSDISLELQNRCHTFNNFASGVRRFIIGLSKKVLIANVLGELIKSFLTETVVSSWLKVIGYTLQIYYDFSGYSDMAIGLGLMFGFHFLENFNYPLIASSITDFWRRWHISLSSWFKDYIYIPLGGNRVSKIKWYRNIFIVWGLTGFWHGANWNFIIWGLYFGIILVIEKMFLLKYLNKTKILKYIYSIFLILIGFLIFNSNSILDITNSIKNMFYINKIDLINQETIYYLKSYLTILIISIILATPFIKNIINKLNNTKFKIIISLLEPITYIILLILSTSFLIDASFNPFLYFRF